MSHSVTLQDCPDLTLRVPVRASSDEQPQALADRMHAAQQQLLRRGTQPTTLALIQQGDIPSNDPWWATALPALSVTHPCLTLSLQLQHIPAQLLARAGQCFPGLHSLVISASPNSPAGVAKVTLPTPTALPQLRHVTIRKVAYDSQGNLWANLKPYMAQLVSLSIGQQKPEALSRPFVPLWFGLFSATSATHTLKRVSLPGRLTTRLAMLIQQHAPAVTELTVTDLGRADANAARVAPQCAWRRLVITYPSTLLSIDWLPLPKQGKLVIQMARDGHAPGVVTEAEVPFPLSDEVSIECTEHCAMSSCTLRHVGSKHCFLHGWHPKFHGLTRKVAGKIRDGVCVNVCLCVCMCVFA